MCNNNYSSADVENIINMIKQSEDSINAIAQLFSKEPDYRKAATTYLVRELKISADDAADIVANLNKGITKFSTRMDVAMTSDKPSFEEMLSRMAENMTDEEKKNRYVDILTALQVINMGNVDLTEGEIADQRRRNALNDEAVLLSEIEKGFDGTLDLQEIGEAVKDGIDKNSLHEVTELFRKSKDGYRMAVAVWMYSSQREGKLILTESQVPLTAKDLGLLASASVEAMLATDDLAQGKITLEKWQTILKCILEILIFTTLFVATSALSIVAIIVALDVIYACVSSQIIALLLYFVALVTILFVSKKTSDGISEMSDWFDRSFDKFITKTTSIIRKLITKMKRLVTKEKDNIDKPDEEKPSTGTGTYQTQKGQQNTKTNLASV